MCCRIVLCARAHIHILGPIHRLLPHLTATDEFTCYVLRSAHALRFQVFEAQYQSTHTTKGVRNECYFFTRTMSKRTTNEYA